MIRKVLVGIVVVIVTIGVVGYAISPYFMESTINEELPANSIIHTDSDTSDNTDTVPKEGDTLTFSEGEEGDTTNSSDFSDVSYAGEFVGVDDGIHDAYGDVYTIPLDDGSDILRLENFRSTNGPELHVYLATDKRATDYIDLGKLKANMGNQNYPIPPGVDIDKYNMALIWCEPFSVLFGSAELEN